LAAEETLAVAAMAMATTMATTMMAMVTATMTRMMTGAVAAARRHRQPLTAWCGAGIRRLEAAEMGIKRKWEQCRYDRLNFFIRKTVTWVYF
jgi:hypothetical protein